MQDKLPHIRRSPEFVMPNHKTANCMLEARNKSPFDFLVSKPSEKKKICIRSFTIACDLGDDDEPVLTAYDRLIYDAVCTLYESGNLCFTTKTVWRVANGMPSNRDPHEDQIARVDESLTVLRKTHVYFDASEEVQARGLGQSATIDGYLLSYKRGNLICDDGKKHTVYAMLGSPIILDHSKAIGQVLRVPYELMNVRKPDGTALHLTVQRMALKGVLMRRITWQRGKSRTFKMSLESTAKDLGTTLSDKRARQILRTDIETMLEFWKQKKHISDYEPYLKGRTIAGYKVEV